jgi:ferritin
MITQKIEKELNQQLNAELFSAYLYLSMSAFLASKNMSGFAHWMRIQFEEEQAHAVKLYDYIIDRGGRVILTQIESPKKEWKDVIEIFEGALAHEQKITGMINDLVNIAVGEKDHATVNMLQWFVSEQVEEEATVTDILEQLKFVDGKGSGLFMIDRELKQRVFVPIQEGN